MWDMQVWSLGQEDPLEKGMGMHCSILAWRIPWTEEPDSLEPTGSQRAGHGWVTKQAEGYQILHQNFLGFRNNMNPILLVSEFAFFQFMCSESPDCLCRQISFVYMAWKWKSLSHVQLFVTLWTVHSPWNSPGQNTGVGSLSLLQQIFPTQVSLIAGRFFTSWATGEPLHGMDTLYFSDLTPEGGNCCCWDLGFCSCWPCHHAAYKMLFPQQGIKPMSPAVEVRGLNHWMARKSHWWFLMAWK